MIRTLVLVVCLAVSCLGFSTGPPAGACQRREPSHSGATRHHLSTTQPAYEFIVPETVKEGEQITVTLRGEQFLGYMVDGLTTASEVVGTFVGPTLDCDGPNSTAVHNNAQSKTSVDLKWTAPLVDVNETIHFRATVVQNYNHYYVNIYSPAITLLDSQ